MTHPDDRSGHLSTRPAAAHEPVAVVEKAKRDKLYDLLMRACANGRCKEVAGAISIDWNPLIHIDENGELEIVLTSAPAKLAATQGGKPVCPPMQPNVTPAPAAAIELPPAPQQWWDESGGWIHYEDHLVWLRVAESLKAEVARLKAYNLQTEGIAAASLGRFDADKRELVAGVGHLKASLSCQINETTLASARADRTEAALKPVSEEQIKEICDGALKIRGEDGTYQFAQWVDVRDACREVLRLSGRGVKP